MHKKIYLKEILFICALGLIIYFNSLQAGFIWDDYSLVVDNPLIRDISKISKVFSSNLSVHGDIFYRPVQNLSYMMDFFLFKFDPRGYHLTNILLHILVAILFFQLCYLLSAKRAVSLSAALIYLASPLWVESVTYISGRADILMGLFIISSFIFFIRKRSTLCIICYILALFSKEASLIYPLIVFFYLAVWRKFDRKYTTLLIGLCVLTCVYALTLLLRSWGLSAISAGSYQLSTRMLFLPVALGEYLALLFFPVNPHMSYTVELPYSILQPRVLLSLLLFIILVGAIIHYLKKDKIISFFLLWFLVFYIPHSGIFPINAFFAEHFIYLSAFGIFAAFFCLLDKLRRRWIQRSILILYLCFFSLTTIRYNAVWGDPVRFYQRIIRLSKNSFAASNNLGVLYLDQGEFDQAKKLFERAIQVKPDFLDARINLARLYYLKGDLRRAIGLIRGVVEEDEENAYAWNYLGTFSLKQGDKVMAEKSYARASALAPGQSGLLLDLYSFYSLEGRGEEAAEIKKKIASIGSYSLASLYISDARYHLANGDLEDALYYADEALKINPDGNGYYRFKGGILEEAGDYEGAFRQYQQALNLAPSDWEAINRLGKLYFRIGFFDDAERYFKKAILLKSDSIDAYLNLGMLYFDNQRTADAREVFRQALIIDPSNQSAKDYLERSTNIAE